MDYEGGGTQDDVGSPETPPGEGAAISLVDALSEAMYDLAHTGAKRVAQLCQAPTGLGCWALELLEEQACTVGPCGTPTKLVPQDTSMQSSSCSVRGEFMLFASCVWPLVCHLRVICQAGLLCLLFKCRMLWLS